MVELCLFGVADGLDDIGEPCLRVDAVELGGFNQGVDDGCMIAGPAVAKKGMFFRPKIIVFTARSETLLSMARQPSLRYFRSLSNCVIA